MKYPKLINIIGPTAVGKTKFAIHLAQKLSCDILSFDSRQIYREFNIGVARPSDSELSKVHHYGIASHSILNPLNAHTFAQFAREVIATINTPYLILVGGNGLYLKALLEGFHDLPEIPKTVRLEVEHETQGVSLNDLQKIAYSIDATYDTYLDRDNPLKIKRLIEVFRVSGKPMSFFYKHKKTIQNSFDSIFLQLFLERALLYDSINERVDKMIAANLEVEVQALRPFWGEAVLNTVGYREFVDFYQGKYATRALAIDKIKQHTRNYAKRQITYNKKYFSQSIPIDASRDFDAQLNFIKL
ncbi:MAG: tRNA (adenosine(37)-N6)-dimethylallyltransferase MiaA [Chitinophagales bacterium]|jgi:tRNA dimethylallyltransferase|nr:tRNA (adenosine(37)-N6)-dimethylallyltransferase MiaA [Chitinophagales bacterium]